MCVHKPLSKAGSMALGKSLTLSEPHFSHLSMSTNDVYFTATSAGGSWMQV